MMARTPQSPEDLFGGGYTGNLLAPAHDTAKVYAWFQRKHTRGHELLDEDGVYHSGEHAWRVPYGVRQALAVPLVHGQVVTKYPFYVTWISPRTGKRYKKRVMHLISAIHLITTKVQYVDPNASIVARVCGYNIPPKLRGKLPRRMNGGAMHYWCPWCMDARKYRRAEDRTFYAQKKFWSEEKQRYVWKEVKLAILRCSVCRMSNQDQKFRSSNQPYEKVRVKQGVRRVKRRSVKRARARGVGGHR
jgi:hypothetical protein